MGVLKLLPMLQSVTDQVHISKYAGKIVGIDASEWVLKGACSYTASNAQGKDSDEYLSYFLRQIKLLHKYEITPLFVFDGAPLSAKAQPNAARNNIDCMNLKHKTLDLHGQGRQDLHSDNFIPTVPSKMICQLLKLLRRMDITFYVAPYDANAQLAYLSRIKMVDAVVTENSNIIPFGCKKVLLKWEENGWVSELQRRSLGANADFSFVGWTEEMFIQFCVLSGCDYCPSVPGVEITTAYTIVQEYRRPQDVIDALQRKKQGALPDRYVDMFFEAILTFRHLLVFDPRDQKLKPLNPLNLSEDILDLVDKDLLFLGDMQQPDHVVVSISRGLMNPITFERYEWEDTPAQLVKAVPSDLLPSVQSMTSSESSKRTIDWGNDQVSVLSSNGDDCSQRRIVARNGFGENDHIKKQRIALQQKNISREDKPSSSWAHLESVLGPSAHILNFRSPKVSDNFKSLVERNSVLAVRQPNTNAVQLRDFETQPVRKNFKRVRNPRNRKREEQSTSGFEGEISCHVTASSNRSDRVSPFEATQNDSQEQSIAVNTVKAMDAAVGRKIPSSPSSPLATTDDTGGLFLPLRDTTALRTSDIGQRMFPWTTQPRAPIVKPMSPLSSYSRASYVEDKWDRILLAEEESNKGSDDEDV